MEKWEYQTLKYTLKGFLANKMDVEEFDNLLNRVGREGWELVSCFDTSMTQGETRHVLAVFKRKL